MTNMKNKDIDKDVQALLDKLISDEWFAGHIYKQFVLLVDNEQRYQIEEQLLDTADDEIDDHMMSLVQFACQNGYDVPTTYNELKKKADKEDIKLFESCKKGEDAQWYVARVIEAEKRAIETYEKYINEEYVRSNPDLSLVVTNNYYDEVEHLKQYEFIDDSLEALKKFPKE